MIELRDYQRKLIDDIHHLIDEGEKRILVVSPTASGKTIIFSALLKEMIERGKRILLLTHRIELLQQSEGAFNKFGIIPQLLTAQTKNVPNGEVVVGMVETVYRRISKNNDYSSFADNFDIVISDESHIGNHDKVYKYFEGKILLGFTATAYRRDPQTPLRKYFDKILLGPSVKELINKGYLSRSMVFGKRFDMSNIKIKNGEFSAEDQDREFVAQGLYSSAVEQYKKILNGAPTLAFTPSVESSKELVRRFNLAGIKAAHVDGTTAKGERKAIFDLFKGGEISILSNVGVATTGFDAPNTKGIMLFLMTRSLVKYLQILGRGARISEGKRYFTVLDFGGNTSRFGFYEDDREWSLDNDPTKFAKEPKTTKICPKCDAVVPIMTKTCPVCGHKFGDKAIREVLVKEIKMELEPLKRYDELLEFIEGKSFMELDIIREIRGYSKKWILHQLNSVEDLKNYAEYMGYKPGFVYYTLKQGWKPKKTSEKIKEYEEWKNTRL